MIGAQILESSNWACDSSYCKALSTWAVAKASALTWELEEWRERVPEMQPPPTSGEIWLNTVNALQLIVGFCDKYDINPGDAVRAAVNEGGPSIIADNIEAITTNLRHARETIAVAKIPGATPGATPGAVPLYSGGSSFTCTTSECKGKTDEVEGYFIALQATINRFAKAAGFSEIKTDGLIGNKTIAALKKVVQYRVSQGDSRPSIYSELAANPMKDTVASYVQSIFRDLSAAADRMGAAVARSNADAASGSGVVTAGMPILATYVPPSPKSNTLYWVIGGVAAAALVGVGFMVWKKRKQNRSSFKPTEHGVNLNVVKRPQRRPAFA
jgi:hypothetical protein